jgi:hypothetical protein
MSPTAFQGHTRVSRSAILRSEAENIPQIDARPFETALAIPRGYILGLGRDVPHPRIAHLYKGTFNDPGLPMCARGWNRDNGQAYSIWRGNEGRGGVCKICWRRAKAGKDGVPARDATA